MKTIAVNPYGCCQTISRQSPFFGDQQVLSDEKLGYSRDTTVVQWMRGSAKVPLRHLSTIANFFSHDIAHVLSAWLAQECPDDPEIVSVADRVITIWEWQLVYVARDIHNYYDE